MDNRLDDNAARAIYCVYLFTFKVSPSSWPDVFVGMCSGKASLCHPPLPQVPYPCCKESLSSLCTYQDKGVSRVMRVNSKIHIHPVYI